MKQARAFVSASRMRYPGIHLAVLAALALPALPFWAQTADRATLPGHVIRALREATRLPHTPQLDDERMTVTVVLKLSDPEGARALLAASSNPVSPDYGRTIGLPEFSARFGPSQDAWDSVLAWLQQNGLTLSHRALDRMTMTVTGTRAQIQNAFGVTVDNYQLGDRVFHAVASDPVVPAAIAPFILNVAGLSNLARPHPSLSPNPPVPASIATAYNGALTPAGTTNTGGLPPGLDGSGVTIGLLEVDGFYREDVINWLAFANLPANLINHIQIFSAVTPSGCTATSPACGTSELLLDVAAAMGIAPGARIEIFENPSDEDYATTMATAYDELATLAPAVLSISLAECEDTISSSDADAIDAIAGLGLALGVSTFAGSGDDGNICIDGSGGRHQNVIAAPSDSPNVVAVGGTTLRVNSSNAYSSESWWSIPGNAGGFGNSQYFYFCGTSPCYPGEPGRPVPDVSMEAAASVTICQPSCVNLAGGTSLATPLWAATWALLLQAASNAGVIPLPQAGNGNLYNFDYPTGLHAPSTMTGVGNDVQHVGLGSPNITKLISLFVPPSITSFSPTNGSFGGGTKVTLHGTGFIGVKSVTFGGNAGTSLTIDSDSKLTVVTPFANHNANAPVKLTTPGGAATASTRFDYDPVIDFVGPPSGPTSGGTTVTVSGVALANDLTFEFIAPGETGHSATKVSCDSTHTSCTMVSPSHAAGTVNVRAVTPWGYTTSISPIDDQFTYK